MRTYQRTYPSLEREGAEEVPGWSFDCRKVQNRDIRCKYTSLQDRSTNILTSLPEMDIKSSNLNAIHILKHTCVVARGPAGSRGREYKFAYY